MGLTLDPMIHASRRVTQADSDAISGLIHRSFTALAAQDWDPSAQATFLGESSPAAMHSALGACAYAAATFAGPDAIGFVLMPRPSLLGMLFVDPLHLRRGVGRTLWEQARAYIEGTHPETKLVELNSTPYAYGFYRSIGFWPVSAEFVKGGCRVTRMACWLPARALGADGL